MACGTGFQPVEVEQVTVGFEKKLLYIGAHLSYCKKYSTKKFWQLQAKNAIATPNS
ncbi:MAG: hypothetical protein F6K41_16170 [Symploca sp. SIO3E6]|nr:hypothetical protein [Caldora sp. SIO3E6]